MKLNDPISAVLRQKGSRRVIAVKPSQSVFEAIELMARESVGAVLVLSENKLVGILSERDYARKVILKGHSSKDTPVHEIMTSPVVFVGRAHTVDECMSVMTEHHFRHLPVLDEDEVVGMVSIGDLVKWIISGQAATIEQLESYISGGYPGCRFQRRAGCKVSKRCNLETVKPALYFQKNRLPTNTTTSTAARDTHILARKRERRTSDFSSLTSSRSTCANSTSAGSSRTGAACTCTE